MSWVSHGRSRRRRLLAAGAVAGPLFLLISGLEGARRSSYRPRRHPISSLALGRHGWVQKANFVLTGAAFLGAGVALPTDSEPEVRSRVGSILICTAGIGLMGAGAFPTDPVSGYPAGTPDTPAATVMGRVHDAASLPVFLGLPCAALIYSWQFSRAGRQGWAVYSLLSGASMAGSLVVSTIGFNQAPRFVDTAGFWQRLSLVCGFAWVTALLGRMLREDSAKSRA